MTDASAARASCKVAGPIRRWTSGSGRLITMLACRSAFRVSASWYPLGGNRRCEEDREVFPQTELADLWEDLAHSTDLQTGQATQRVTRPLRSNLRRSQWREVQ
jgi:hypothetical protein